MVLGQQRGSTGNKWRLEGTTEATRQTPREGGQKAFSICTTAHVPGVPMLCALGRIIVTRGGGYRPPHLSQLGRCMRLASGRGVGSRCPAPSASGRVVDPPILPRSSSTLNYQSHTRVHYRRHVSPLVVSAATEATEVALGRPHTSYSSPTPPTNSLQTPPTGTIIRKYSP